MTKENIFEPNTSFHHEMINERNNKDIGGHCESLHTGLTTPQHINAPTHLI
jgi:hypothetical protein